ncbi:hypothetical protein [Marinoscillum sp. MHG1-6]|uniref:hypothetical protein n=1 Tax=Marinoscillum sp. MHG1-6 TaxID=2959627 RepID=UPI0021574F92|nr:hypothetical protein [Marinoscillum sp. MHG1-6]
MKHAISATLLILLLVTTTLAQQKKAGPIFKHTMKMAWADIEPITDDDNGTYYLLYPYGAIMAGAVVGPKEYYIGRVDESLEMSKTGLLVLQKDEQEREFEFALESNGSIYVFSSYQDISEKTTYLYAQTFNKETFALNDDLRKIGQVDFTGENRFKNAVFEYEFSQDRSKLLITYYLLDKDGSLIRFGYDVLDSSLKRLSNWNGLVDMSEGIYQFDQFRISNSGSVYLLTRFFSNKKEFNNSTKLKKDALLSSSRSMVYESDYEIKVIKFSHSSGSTKVLPVDLASQFITVTDMVISGSKLTFIGFYAPVGSSLPEGAFYMEMDGNGKILKTDKSHFGDLFIQPSDVSDKENGLLNTAEYDSYRFVIKDIIHRSNGGFALAAERTVTQTKTQNSGGYVTVTTVNHTDDIAVVDVSASGKISKVHKIEKSQQTMNLGYLFSSFYCTESKGKLLVFYTNLGKSNATMMGKMIKTKAYLTTIDGQGNLDKKVIFSATSDRITLRAKDSYQRQDGNMVLYGHENNRYSGFIEITP